MLKSRFIEMGATEAGADASVGGERPGFGKVKFQVCIKHLDRCSRQLDK